MARSEQDPAEAVQQLDLFAAAAASKPPTGTLTTT
jgi:hypothetical protein